LLPQVGQATVGAYERFSEIAPEDFRAAIDEVWLAAAGKIKDTVAGLVEQNVITPVQGLGIMSCVSAQLLGYQEFHGGTNMGTLLATPRQEQRETAGAQRH
jgi:hypothetical protein